MKKIVLTGGPCAGKSSAEKFLEIELKKLGWEIVFVPETATRIIKQYDLNPAELRKTDRQKYLKLQRLIMERQLLEEAEAERRARFFYPDSNVLIICDRGTMDGAAYMEPHEFSVMIRAMEAKRVRHQKSRPMYPFSNTPLNRVGLRDLRYEAVFHLVTAADGAEAHYNWDNSARFERNLDVVREFDKRVQKCWLGHPHLRIIDNSTLFDQKLERLLNEIKKALGIPQPTETERKFLVKNFNVLDKIPVSFQIIEIEQIYLRKKDGVRTRIRKRGQANEGEVYYETKKFPTESEISRVEIERRISEEEYLDKKKEADPDFDAISKRRVCFLWKNQYFELDIFKKPERHRGLTLLEIELTEENDEVNIPDWLGEVIEVSTDPNYKNKNLARKPA